MVLTPHFPKNNIFFGSFTSTHTITPEPRLPAAAKKEEPVPPVAAPAAPTAAPAASENAETGIGGAWLKCIPVFGGALNVTHGLMNLGQAVNAARKKQWEVAGPRAIQGVVRIMAGSFNVLVYGAMLPFPGLHHATTEYFIPSWGATLSSERQLMKFDNNIKHIEQLDKEGRTAEARAEARKAEKEVLGSITEDLPGVGGHGLQAAKTVTDGAKLFMRFRPGKKHELAAQSRDAGHEIHN